MNSLDLRIDVTEAVGHGQPAEIVVTVHLPDPAALPDRPVVCFGLPGGGYNRSYFSMDLPGTEPGGQAAWHTDRGWVVVAIDHLQVGDSSTYEPDLLTFEHIVAGDHAAVDHVLGALRSGALAEGFPPITSPFRLGVGQSMGGCFTIVQQAHHRSFDAIAVLGYSAIHTIVPSAPGTPNLAMPWMTRAGYPLASKVLNPEVLEAAAHEVTDADQLAEAVDAGGHIWTWAFHHEAESRELVEADMAAMSGGPMPSWRSATIPACAILQVAPGAVATEAASITVPVFIGNGERDVVPDPWIEPRAYLSSSDITTAVFPQMAHMHNFAPTRERLWRRLHDWAASRALG